ncbi:hypothetical protein AB1Y20_004742 [Prymnesium parvum]|uniref:Pectinesterase inhibitor domain-containing protein n=1 Tax=Prymnesium parvum TaxID=97485 RepID=A0AB34IX58_PRYPA
MLLLLAALLSPLPAAVAQVSPILRHTNASRTRTTPSTWARRADAEGGRQLSSSRPPFASPHALPHASPHASPHLLRKHVTAAMREVSAAQGATASSAKLALLATALESLRAASRQDGAAPRDGSTASRRQGANAQVAACIRAKSNPTECRRRFSRTDQAEAAKAAEEKFETLMRDIRKDVGEKMAKLNSKGYWRRGLTGGNASKVVGTLRKKGKKE